MSLEWRRGLDEDEAKELVGALLELRGQLRKLQWYGEVNRRGFIKITKKLDKKVPMACTQRRYLQASVDPKPFASNAHLSDMMTTINDWLSRLTEDRQAGDDGSTRPFRSIPSKMADEKQPYQVDHLEAMVEGIREDRSGLVSELLARSNAASNCVEAADVQRSLFLHLLQRAISCNAKACIELLLGRLDSLDEDDDINARNCLHRLVIAIGRSERLADGDGNDVTSPGTEGAVPPYITPAATPINLPASGRREERDSISLAGHGQELVDLFEHVLIKLRPHQRTALVARDAYGRMPLHYAAQYGLVVVCQMILRHMKSWKLYNTSDLVDAAFWQDTEGWAPLHLSILARHPTTAKVFLDSKDRGAEHDDGSDLRRIASKSDALLSTATKANSLAIVKLLVEAGADINCPDEQGETALHVAARFGYDECAKILLDGNRHHKANLEVAEKTFSWTPLFVACVEGNLGIVELLIDAGAQLDQTDLSGWTAKDHAVLRGHMAIARRLAAVTTTESSDSGSSSVGLGTSPSASSLDERISQVSNRENGSVRLSDPVKRFGHRYLEGESLVLVSLGTMDTRRVVEPVRLDRIPFAHAHFTQLDTALSVVVSATDATGEPSVIDLPVQDNICTEPIAFTTRDPAKVKLLFDIVPTYAGSKDQVVGRGVALLSSIKPTMGSERSTLHGDVSVPIIAASTLEVIGTVHFNILVIKPFTHPNMSITQNQTYWKSMTSPTVIGHRGEQLL